MFIRFNYDCYLGDKRVNGGEVYDLYPEIAKKYIADGAATLVTGDITIPAFATDLKTFVHIGDSRTASLVLATGADNLTAKTAGHWFNWASALSGQNIRWTGNFGITGNRTDQYLAANLASALATAGGWIVFGFPAVNDIAQATTSPYTNLNGVPVTVSNVAQVAASNIQAAALQALAAGKRVIICGEPGSTTMTQAQVGQVFQFNERMRDFCDDTQHCYFWDVGPVVWNPTSSATAIVMKTGYSADGTHYTSLGSYFQAKDFNAKFGSMFPLIDLYPANIADVFATNPLQIGLNPLFSTLTGGTVGTNVTVSSGTVPSGWQISGTTNQCSVAITSAANANGYGNDVTLTVTAAGSDTLIFQQPAIPAANWALTDIFQAGIECAVAAGSSNATVGMECQIVSDLGGPNNYDLYAQGYGAGPTEAYNVKLLTMPKSVKLGSVTKFYVAPMVKIIFTGPGSAAFTLRRPFTRKRYS